MKKHYLFPLFCLFTIFLSAHPNTIVMGSLTDVGLMKEIELQMNQKYLNGRVDQYRSNILEDGTFAFSIEVNEPQVATLLYSRNKALIYLEPGDTLYINSSGNSFQYSLRFSGPGGTNNSYYTDYLEKHPPRLNPLELLQYKKGIYWFANSPDMDIQMQRQGVGQFTHELKLIREKANADLTFYTQNNPDGLSSDFVDFLNSEINYDWAYHLLLYGSVYKNVHQVDDSFFDYLKEVPLHEGHIGSYWYRHFLQAFVNYQYLQGEYPGDPFIEQYNLADTLLENKGRAYFQSQMIYRAFSAKHLDEILPHYTKFLEQNPYEDFDEKIVRSFQKAMRYAVGTSAPDFSAKDLEEEVVSLGDYAGKVVFLNFWASWCRPCMEKMKELKPIQAELEKQDIVFLNISMDRKKEMWLKAIENNEFGGKHILLKGDINAEIAQKYEVKALPEYFIIDKKGSFAEKPIIYDIEALRKVLEHLNQG